MSGLLMALVGGCIVAVAVITLRLTRWQRRRRDSVESFSAATSALRYMAEHPPTAAGDPPHPQTDTATVHMLDERGDVQVTPTRSARASTRPRRRRPDADAVARRPTIASLPSVSSSKPLRGPDDERGR